MRAKCSRHGKGRETDYHLTNSAMFVELLQSLKLSPSDVLVSLNVVYLFTKVPLDPTLRLQETLFPSVEMELFKFVLCSIYFTFDSQFLNR